MIILICDDDKNCLANEEKYIRDFLNCSVIDRNSDAIKLDKVIFIYKYGSKMAKKIAMDEKLKMM